MHTYVYYPAPDSIGDWVLFSIDLFVYMYLCFILCFFVSKITRKRLDRFPWNFQRRCVVTMGRPDSILGEFRENMWWRNADFFVSICQHYEQMAGPICMKFPGKVWSYHGMTWLHFWSFPRNRARCRDAQHGDGVCCALAPQLVVIYIR